MNKEKIQNTANRMGIHYYQDTQHYQNSDLEIWLPRMQALGIGWVTLQAPLDRCIPEEFLKGLIGGGIQPILHFPFKLSAPPAPDEVGVLFKAYARWGVNYAVLFDRPNMRTSWETEDWSKEGLTDRFVEAFFLLANVVHASGIKPVLPPLEPGGHYWDTAFLRTVLKAMQEQASPALMRDLVIGAVAQTTNRPLHWGMGGPERWANATPYETESGGEDQRGLYIFDWYAAISQAVTGKPLPMLLFQTGWPTSNGQDTSSDAVTSENQTSNILNILNILSGEETISEGVALNPIPEFVLAANFWLLAADPDSPHASQAWFNPQRQDHPVVTALGSQATASQNTVGETSAPTLKSKRVQESHEKPIPHYLLLPLYEWGIADWHLDVIRPFIKHHQPTVGFSIVEAGMAERVTVIGGTQTFSTDTLNALRAAGSVVHRISGDGTSIATELATL